MRIIFYLSAALSFLRSIDTVAEDTRGGGGGIMTAANEHEHVHARGVSFDECCTSHHDSLYCRRSAAPALRGD